MSIRKLTIITAQGVNCYEVGRPMYYQDDKRVIEKIEIKPLYFQGDPYDHYCGFDENGEMMFSVNCLAPCEVIY